MRFAITATDRYLGVFNALLDAGWEPMRLFSWATDGRMFQTSAVIERALKLKIGIQLSRMDELELQHLSDAGCEVLVVASYKWRIGEWQRFVPHAINFHPSLLPEFRGCYPLVNGLLERRTRWGVTCHKIAADFDTGDILAQRGFDIAPQETHETLDLKTQMAATALARQVAGDFAALWAGATPQSQGSHAPLFSDATRTLDFTTTVEHILQIVRAFGRFECLATLHGMQVRVTQAAGWQETHDVPPNTVVHEYARTAVVACRDGYIAILEWHLFGPGVITGTGMPRQ